MRLSKQILMFLGGGGLLLLAACSSGQPSASSSPSAASPDAMAKTDMAKTDQSSTAQIIAPATQTGEVRMTLDAASLKQGKNTLTLMVKDTKGQPIAAKDVQVALSMSAKEMESMGMKGMGDGSAKTQVKPATTPGTFAVEADLPFSGNWQMNVDLKDAQAPASAVFNLPVE